MLGSATASTYEAVLPVLLEDRGVDAVLVLFVPPVTATADQVALAVARAAAGAEKPIVAAVMDARGIPPVLLEAGVASYGYPESAARALGRAAARAEWLRRPAGSVPVLEGIDRGRARGVVAAALEHAPDLWLDPDDSRALLEAYGIPVVEQRVAAHPTRQLASPRSSAFRSSSRPRSPERTRPRAAVSCSTSRREDDVREAAARIGGAGTRSADAERQRRAAGRARPGRAVRPADRARPGRCAGRADRRRRRPDRAAHGRRRAELVLEGKTGALVRGYRGKPAADADAVVDVLHRLSALGEDLPEVAELDLNPLIVGPDGCVAVDARVRVGARCGRRRRPGSGVSAMSSVPGMAAEGTLDREEIRLLDAYWRAANYLSATSTWSSCRRARSS